MKAKKPLKFESGSRSHVAQEIEAANRTFKDYLLRQHLSLWQPISTAPNNHDLELKVLDGGSSVVLPFPCKRTNAGEWINADLESAVDIRPTKWRPWQKAKPRKPQFSTRRDFPHHNGRRWSDT
jgi:hypothetical protein